MLPLASNSALIAPSPGLMIWTLVTFALVLLVLYKVAFRRLAELLEQRRKAVHDNLQAAEDARAEAQRLLEEYRAQLQAARHEATDIVERARRTGEEERRRMLEELAAERERGIASVQSAIQAEMRQAIDAIKTAMADLTLEATEIVLRRKLDDAEANRLIDEALSDVDLSRLTGERR
jgi:F-type H+-transporting ATPase subunit b